MSNSLRQRWGRQGQVTLCLSSHKECHINCHRRLAIRRQWLERARETGSSHTYVYRPVTSIRQLHMKCVCKEWEDHTAGTVGSHPAEALTCNSHAAAIQYKNEGRKQKQVYKIIHKEKNQQKQVTKSLSGTKGLARLKRPEWNWELQVLRKPRTPGPPLPSSISKERGEVGGSPSTGKTPRPTEVRVGETSTPWDPERKHSCGGGYEHHKCGNGQ